VRITLKTLTVLFFLSAALAVSCRGACAGPETVSSSALFSDPGLYDGRTISFEGEIIGDIMKRGRYAWINVNDGRSAIGVFTAAENVAGLSAGGYKRQGDIVRVSGEFHRACPGHGGDMDIHAGSVTVIIKSAAREEAICPAARRMAVLLAGAICLLLISMLYGRLRKKR